MATVTELVSAAEELIVEGAVEDAAQLLQQALRRAPSSLAALKAYATCLMASEQIEGAIKVLEHALAIAPNNAELRLAMGAALSASGRAESAKEQLEEAVALEPDVAEYHENLGVHLAEHGELDRGIGHLLKALELKPENPSLLANLSVVLMRVGAIYDARRMLQHAIDLNPEHTEAKLLLATLLSDIGLVTEALDLIEPLYLKQPRNPHLLAILSTILAQTGQIEDANDLIETAVRLAPELISVVEAYTLVSAYAGEADKGIQHAAKFITRLQNKEVGYLVLANALTRVGKYDEAIVTARKALTDPQCMTGANDVIRSGLLLTGRFDELKAFDAARRLPRIDVSAPSDGASKSNGSAEDPAIIIPFEMQPLDVLVMARFLRGQSQIDATSDPATQEVFAPNPLHDLLARVVPGSRLSPLDAVPRNDNHTVDFSKLRVLAQFDASEDFLDHKPDLAIPYLHVDRGRDELWNGALADLPRPLIGFTWHRYPPHPRLLDMRLILSALGGTALSLVWDEDMRAELETFDDLVDAGYHFVSLAAPVDLIDKLDLVIGPDTLPLHIAGAQGKPALALLPPNKPWYWYAADGRSHWYPSVRCVQRDWQTPWSAYTDKAVDISLGLLSNHPSS